MKIKYVYATFKRGNVQRLELKTLVSKKGTIYVQGHEPRWISPPKTWHGEHRKCKSANTTPDVRLPRLCRHQLRNRMLGNVFVILLASQVLVPAHDYPFIRENALTESSSCSQLQIYVVHSRTQRITTLLSAYVSNNFPESL